MNPLKSFVEYLRSAVAELEKVAWPSKEDVVRYSSLIVAVSVVAAVFFGALDAGLQSGVRAIIAARAGSTAAPATSDAPPITADDLQVQAEPVTASGTVTQTQLPVPTTNVITGEPLNPAPPSR